ncbi:hypothetical protein ASD06_15915 [Angustibacter sp. Root456]|nr:hypothetical protein ASD06_15915 [Angustibacter sp. Root456]
MEVPQGPAPTQPGLATHLRGHLAAWSAAQWVSAVLTVLALALGGLVARNVVVHQATHDVSVPRSGAMELATGVRFDRVAVVGDGGLVEVSFVALDVDKAQAFMEDSANSPTIRAEDRAGGTERISVMRQGHNMRPGQTYYFVYQNTGGAVRPGEHVTLVVGSQQLRHVPVR